MRIGVPRETRNGERRVALVPDGARTLIGAVLEPGTLSPNLIRREVVRAMRPGSAIVVQSLASLGIAAALEADAGLAAGLMAWGGVVAHPGLARDAGRTFSERPWRRRARAA